MPSVTRCVYNWLYDMWMEVADRPRVWDQDVFRKVMVHCSKAYGVRWHAFSPRHLNSYCYKPCGCDYDDADKEAQLDRCVCSFFCGWCWRGLTCHGGSARQACVQLFLQVWCFWGPAEAGNVYPGTHLHPSTRPGIDIYDSA